jgi:hypothetical protein
MVEEAKEQRELGQPLGIINLDGAGRLAVFGFLIVLVERRLKFEHGNGDREL